MVVAVVSDGAVALRQTCERRSRVKISIAVRARCEVSTRACVLREMRTVESSTEIPPKSTSRPIDVPTSSSISVKPPSSRATRRTAPLSRAVMDRFPTGSGPSRCSRS